MKNYVVAACTSWHKELFRKHSVKRPGNWFLVESEDQLENVLRKLDSIEQIFFLHWRNIVPSATLERYSCICFHMTDLPYGRGGSPLQNLILAGHKETQVCALKMTEELDAGPVYLRAPLQLSGSAQSIYQSAAKVSWELILRIIDENPVPEQQTGEVTLFKRRKPEQSELPKALPLDNVYDFIRMLDAEGYPHAFIEAQGYKLCFNAAELKDGQLTAKVVIRRIEDNNDEPNHY